MKISGVYELSNAAKEMKEVKEIMEQSNPLSVSLNRNAENLFSPFSEISPTIKAAKETAIQDTAKLRSPEILNTRITMDLIKNDINAKAWDTATPAMRNEMMDKMFGIMLEEMQIPDQVRKGLRLVHTGTKSAAGNMVVAGHCNRFIGLNEFGKMAVTETPMVEMHHALMYQDFDTALGALYNQAVKVMQQSTCLEPEGTYADVAEQAKWTAEVKDQINGKVAQVSDMQQFAVSAEKDMLSRYHSIIKSKGITAKAISFK